MDEKVKKFLYDISTSIENIFVFTEGRDLSSFSKDTRTKQAVERNFEIIGEAINNTRKIAPTVSDQIRESSKIIGFRNQLIHGYDMISDPITWDIVKNKLPLLSEDISKFDLSA
ncbi:MAG: HepT-like ribonuclease domain-containing protein [Bacteroidota bacterium]